MLLVDGYIKSKKLLDELKKEEGRGRDGEMNRVFSRKSAFAKSAWGSRKRMNPDPPQLDG